MNALRIFSLLVLVVLLGCQKEQLEPDRPQTEQAIPTDPLSRAAVNDIILEHLDRQQDFRWDMVNTEVIWSAALLTDSVLTIGFKPTDEGDIHTKMHQINLGDSRWVDARQQVIDAIEKVQEEENGQPTPIDEHPRFKAARTLPLIQFKTGSYAVIEQLRQMPQVRYIEPVGYHFEAEADSRSGLGCNVDPASYIDPDDFTPATPNVKIPWNFDNMNIPNAWSTTSGNNVAIALIDTGTSPDQDKLGSDFNSGQSQGRYIDRYGTYVSSWWWWADPDGPDDRCGHGTQMAGLLAAPRGYDGTSVGVAYNSDLVAIRGTGDVVISSSRERNGVTDALILAANRNDVRIISMSIGTPFWSNQIADAVYYAYGKDKMMFAAAGTSTWYLSWVGVVFPARMAQTVAVTGVKDGESLQKCNTCHSGSQVDFVAVMQRAVDNDRTSLTLTQEGNQPANVGGSSAATATTAGIAALVWSTDPSMNRSQVMTRLKNAASIYPQRDSDFGWGIVDAPQAVNSN